MSVKTTAKIGLALLVVVGIGAFTYLNRTKNRSAELVRSVQREQSPVRTVVVAPTTLKQVLAHTGTLRANRDVVLTSEVSGKVKRKFKRMGDPCRKGDTLLQLDTEHYRIVRQQAAASLRQGELGQLQSKRDLTRAQKLAKRSVVAQEVLERAQTAVQTSAAGVQRARAALALAQRNLRLATVRCPFDGLVADEMVELGQMVGPQTPLARLVDASTLKVRLEVSAAELSKLREGQSVQLKDSAVPPRTFEGKVSRLGVAADPATRTFPVEVVIDASVVAQKGALRPGTVVRSRIEVGQYENVLTLPEEAVLAEGGDHFAYLVVNGKVKKRRVHVTARVTNRVVIDGGLTKGEAVIVAGQHGLREGDSVTSVNIFDSKAKVPIPSQPSSEPKS